MREQNHIAYRRGVREEHHETINADTKTCGGRHAVLERTHIIRVVKHRFLVASVFARDLRTKACGLLFGIVELGEAVRELAPGEIELEAVRDKRVCFIRARERRYLGRVCVDECGIEQSVLDRFLENLKLQLAWTVVRAHGGAETLTHLTQVRRIPDARAVEV